MATTRQTNTHGRSVDFGIPERSPALFKHDRRLLWQLVYAPFGDGEMLTQAQKEALQDVEKTARENCIEIQGQTGDIQLFNNHAILHARSQWEDKPGRQRHYLRMGLRDPQYAWAKPPGHRKLFEDHFQTPTSMQTIPITDFDPYGRTDVGSSGAAHG